MATITQTRTNLATNPSFETASGTTTVRTNLCKNPSLEVDTTGWAVNSGTGTATAARVASGGYSGSSFVRATWTAATTAAGYLEYAHVSTGDGSFVAGKVYTVSAYVRTSVALTVQPQIGWATGGGKIGTATGTATALTANVWTLLTFTSTAAPANTDGAWFDWVITSGTMPVNGTLDVDAVLIEQSSVAGAYFDGSYTGTGDFTYSWAGTANASKSLATAQTTPGWAPVSGAIVYRSTADSYAGTACTAMSVTGMGQGGYQGFAASAASPGLTYTLSAWVKGPAGQKFRQDFDYTTNGSNWAVLSYNGLQTFTGAWQRTTITATTPAGTQTIATGIKSDSSFSGLILVDAVMVEQAPAASAYFDGDTAAVTAPGYSPAATRYYSWSGTPGGSASAESLSVPLQDYQLQLPNGAITGAGQPVGLTAITGLRDLASLRSSDSDNAGQDGATPGMSYSTKRAVAVKFLIASPSGGAEAAYGPLARNWQNVRDPSSVCLTAASYLSQLAAGGSLPVSALQVQLPGRTDPLLLLGRPSKLGLPVDHDYQFGWWNVDAEWTVPDGLLYDATPNIVTCAAMIASSGAPFAWGFPVRFPVSSGGTVTALNGGTYPAKPVYKITGPVTNPRISNPATGQAVQINLTLASGDVLIVDSSSRAVRLNGVNRNTALDVGSSFFDVPPGGAALRYSSSDSSPTGSLLTVYTLDTYSTV